MAYEGVERRRHGQLASAVDPLDFREERFSVVRELGRGGMGVVLLVEDRLRGQQLALKRMRHAAGVDIRRLKREYRAIEGLVHPNIVSVFELGIDGQGPYFLMEPVSGTNLSKWCRGRDGGEASSPAETSGCIEQANQPFGAVVTDLGHSLMATASFSVATGTLEQAAAEPSRPAGRAALAPLDAEGLERLYSALPQLLAALDCLHERRLVHRDLKPGNVLVRKDGVLKLLDFGILGETGSAVSGAGLGTAPYMAPEQIRGEPPTPANDLYALGVMLFEVVTGHRPFVGATREDVLFQHLRAAPVPVRTLAPACPEWLHGMIADLLRKDPVERPSLSELVDRCTAEAPQLALPAPGATSLELIERAEEQQVLLDLLDDAASRSFRFVAISGATGLGKSVLLDWTRAAADRRQLTVFHSRTRFSERVPFNAVDGIVDDLAALLERFPGLTDDREGGALRDRAGAAFGVLRRVSELRGGADPRDAFDALIALLARCTQVTGRVVLLCDDLQWADADSISFLRRLVRAAPSDILLVATVRNDTHTDAFSDFWSDCRPELRIELKRLSDRALAHIIGEVAADAGRPIPESAARLAATVCDGRPLLAVVSGRVAARTDIAEQSQPISWLLSQYASDGSSERYLLSLLAVLDGSAALPQLARMTGRAPGAIDELLAPLVRERLILAAGSFGEQRFYDFSHDLIRRQALELLDAREVRAAHAAIIDHTVFGAERGATLVRHLLGAERWEHAGETAAIAAREAEGSRAFGLAAELYEIAIQHTRGERDALRSARAVTLERSGRYVDAAREWRRVADERRGQLRIDALLQQAKALLATEHISEGRNVLRLVQREQQDRSWVPERWANIGTAVRFMLGPWAAPGRKRLIRERPSTPADERDVFLGTMIGFFNPIAGVRHMLRARRVYREVGNRIQAAEVDYVLAYVAIWSKIKQGDTSLGERFANSARDVLGGQTLPEHGRPYALDWSTRGMCALHVGDWERARAAFQNAIAFYESIGRKLSFEHLYCWIQLQFADRFSQDMSAWGRTLETVQRLTDEGQDSVLRCEVAFGRTRYALMRGDLEEASRLCQKARDAWPKEEMSYQSYVLDFYLLAPEMYQTDGLGGRERMQQILKKYARLRPGGGMFGGDMLSHLAWFEAAALRRRIPDTSYRKIERLAERAEQACPLGRHMAMRALAYAADYIGKPEDALVQLARAEQRAAEVNQLMDVAIARYQRGIRLLGSEGKALVSEAEALMAKTGAHSVLLHEDPARR